MPSQNMRHFEIINRTEIEGPFFKDGDSYLSKDGTNPEAPEPGYGWPLGSECWYFTARGRGLRMVATGSTVERALERARYFATCARPAYACGAVSGTGIPDVIPTGMPL